jgi:hypothetical protein
MTKFNDLDIADFRHRAAAMRALARDVADPKIKREALIVAEAWDQLVSAVLEHGMGAPSNA